MQLTLPSIPSSNNNKIFPKDIVNSFSHIWMIFKTRLSSTIIIHHHKFIRQSQYDNRLQYHRFIIHMLIILKHSKTCKTFQHLEFLQTTHQKIIWMWISWSQHKVNFNHKITSSQPHLISSSINQPTQLKTFVN